MAGRIKLPKAFDVDGRLSHQRTKPPPKLTIVHARNVRADVKQMFKVLCAKQRIDMNKAIENLMKFACQKELKLANLCRDPESA